VQSALDSSTVIIAKAADTGRYIIVVLFTVFLRIKNYLSLGKASFRRTTEVKDYFYQFADVRLLMQWLEDMGWKSLYQSVQVIADYFLQSVLHCSCSAVPCDDVHKIFVEPSVFS